MIFLRDPIDARLFALAGPLSLLLLLVELEGSESVDVFSELVVSSK